MTEEEETKNLETKNLENVQKIELAKPCDLEQVLIINGEPDEFESLKEEPIVEDVSDSLYSKPAVGYGSEHLSYIREEHSYCLPYDGIKVESKCTETCAYLDSRTPGVSGTSCDNDGSVWQIECSVCEEKYDNITEYTHHLNMHSGDIPVECVDDVTEETLEISYPEQTLEMMNSTHGVTFIRPNNLILKVFFCPGCKAQFSDVQALSSHKKSNCSGDITACNRPEYTHYLNMHLDVPVECVDNVKGQCLDISFLDRTADSIHRGCNPKKRNPNYKIIPGNNNYPCSDKHPREENIKKHQMANQEVFNSLTCSFCDRTFLNTGGLQRHIQYIHSEIMSGRDPLTDHEQHAQREKDMREKLNKMFMDLQQVIESCSKNTGIAQQEVNKGKPCPTFASRCKPCILSNAIKLVSYLQTQERNLKAEKQALLDHSTSLTAQYMDLKDKGQLNLHNKFGIRYARVKLVDISTTPNLTLSSKKPAGNNVNQCIKSKKLIKMDDCETVRNDRYLISCKLCKGLFGNRSELADHVKEVHHELKPFTCTLCDKSFAQIGNLSQHMTDVHKCGLNGQRYPCILCNVTFSSVQYLTMHNLVFHDKKE